MTININISDHGADVNLQTTNSGRTVFHQVICNSVTDHELVERMITLGALINLTDVHGTTPYMDVIRNTNCAVKIYNDFIVNGKVSVSHMRFKLASYAQLFPFQRVLIDAQNCVGETSFWKAMIFGKLECAKLLIDESVNTSLLARVRESNADCVSLRLTQPFICILKRSDFPFSSLEALVFGHLDFNRLC